MKQHILFIYSPWTTFTKEDFEILSSQHTVVKKQFKPQKGVIKVGVEFIKQAVYLFISLRKFDSVYIWFADYHSFLPILLAQLFHKKSFLVLGGYDLADFPDLKYGSMTSPLRKWMTLYSLRNATLCLPVVEQLERKLKHLCPQAQSKTVHTGYTFKLNEGANLNAPREKCILTVSITSNYQRYMIKGLDRFKELARLLPDYTFLIVGIQEAGKKLFEDKPENLVLLPPVPQEELTQHYVKAAFYAQFSRSEGLPNALCEAMVYGCVPLGVNAGGIGTAMSNWGLMLDEWNPQKMAEFIKRNQAFRNRQEISNSIIHKFDFEKRVARLTQVMQTAAKR